MQMVSPSSLAYLVIQSHIWLHNWTLNYILIFLLFQGLNLEEMADMPSCNLSETAHNKWLQQSCNRGNDLFVATCDDKIRAVMQMTNYRAYLKGKASGTSPSKQELKLRAARHSGDPKKIKEALSQLLGMEVATTRIPHLEGEEIFGSTNWKLDLLLGDDGDSHRPDNVNFSQPRMQTRSKTAHTEFAGASVAGADKDELPHVTTALESDCDMSQWHIARISHKSSYKCHAQQRATNVKCTARIAKGSKGTPAPTYRGRKTQYGGTKEIVTDFWFCPNDIERCVKGSKCSWVLDWPQVPDVWPILSGTNLTHEETLLLQDVGFKLQERPSMSPRCMFTLSNLFEAPVFDQPGPPNPDIYPTTRNSKSFRRNANAPTAEHRNKWESSRNIKGTVLGVTVLPFPSLGAIISLKSRVEPDKKVYQITISHFPECTCTDFLNMAVASIGKRG
jgi:hypothetical protein